MAGPSLAPAMPHVFCEVTGPGWDIAGCSQSRSCGRTFLRGIKYPFVLVNAGEMSHDLYIFVQTRGKLWLVAGLAFLGGISATYNTITRNISSAAASMSRGSQQIWLSPLLCLATARKPPCGSSLAPSQHLPVEWTSPVLLTWPGAQQGELSQSCRRWLKETPHLSLHT